ncbi:hypothetical protein J6590_010866 [Homalodisca vitripennis]|nr:hypothetical protein J6590_010866 [Homalodisca vitripennis]
MFRQVAVAVTLAVFSDYVITRVARVSGSDRNILRLHCFAQFNRRVVCICLFEVFELMRRFDSYKTIENPRRRAAALGLEREGKHRSLTFHPSDHPPPHHPHFPLFLPRSRAGIDTIDLLSSSRLAVHTHCHAARVTVLRQDQYTELWRLSEVKGCQLAATPRSFWRHHPVKTVMV